MQWAIPVIYLTDSLFYNNLIFLLLLNSFNLSNLRGVVNIVLFIIKFKMAYLAKSMKININRIEIYFS